MLLIDYLAQLAGEEKIKLDEEERKNAAADQLHQDSLLPQMEQRPDHIRYICRRKRTPRDVEYVIRNTPEGRFKEYPKQKLNNGTDFDEGQPPHRDENWRRERLLKKPKFYDGNVKVNKQVAEKTIEYEGTSNGVSKRKRLFVKTLENRDEESYDDELYEGQKSIKKRKKEGTGNGILIRERILKEGFEEGFRNKNEIIKKVVCKENGAPIREGFLKEPVESSDEETDDNELYQGEKSIKNYKEEDRNGASNGIFIGKTNKKKEEGFDHEPSYTKSVKGRKDVYEGPIPPPGLPEKVKEQMCERAKEKGGVFDEKNEAILVIQKALTVSDVTRQQNRITIPVNKMNEDGFLNADEEAFLDISEGKHCNRMMVDIIEPSGTVKVAPLSKWKMQKERGKPSISYIVNGEWKDIVLNNGLEAGKVVQLWATRISEELCLAFVILD